MIEFLTVMQNVVTILAIPCIAMYMYVNCGRHTIGARWFGLAALLLGIGAGLPLLVEWHQGTFYITGILLIVAVLSFWVPEKESLEGEEKLASWQFWKRRDEPYRPYDTVDGKPPVPYAVLRHRAIRKGETPPPPPWQK